MRRKHYLAACWNCFREFSSTRKGAFLCSPKCRQARYRTLAVPLRDLHPDLPPGKELPPGIEKGSRRAVMYVQALVRSSKVVKHEVRPPEEKKKGKRPSQNARIGKIKDKKGKKATRQEDRPSKAKFTHSLPR